jgi:hypothetical protein
MELVILADVGSSAPNREKLEIYRMRIEAGSKGGRAVPRAECGS